MTQDTVKQGAQAGCRGSGCCGEEMSARTMPEMCRQMMGKRPSAFIVLIGVLLVALGALIVFQPQVLVWLAAAAVTLMGVMLLAIAGFLRRAGARPRSGTGT